MIQIKSILKIQLVLLLTSGLLTSSCAEQAQEKPKEDKFELTDNLLGKLKIDTVGDPGKVTVLSFSARITPNEETTARIYPMVSGNVLSVPVKLGDRVAAGQVLAVLGSPEMATYNRDAISAVAELQTATRTFTQAEDMYTSGIVSGRELEQARNDLQSKQAEYNRTRAVLRLNGGGTNGHYRLKSPVSGIITEKNVTNNMQIRQDYNNSLFTVADLSEVWGIINVYESDISRIQEGDKVTLAMLSYPDRIFTGRIDKIYNILDEDSKVMHARVIIPNPGFLLKPGMMATVQVSARNKVSLPAIQTGNIIFDENKHYVLVLDPQKKIRVQEVRIEHQSGALTYISGGLQAGDRIVASRQVFLYGNLKD